ncbi:mRNA-capping enzyme subunit alpha [Ascosphaera apis ARSEF 7405]|uniref:mRNA-capping enzyme subunit alpha n=1 Tax=Ascosphaera apis ARSEF 7405 TaxID=392613 RepID=A0A168A684_9EURO|nr:mRNA-capping enzyme subunit alpha [Ascosphaera apis ARSEF 7405]
MDPSALTSVPDLNEIGQLAHPDLDYELKTEIARLLDRHKHGFPGAQPVSFARRHLYELTQRDYYVVEKTDGIRCLLYCARGDERFPAVHYLIDRKNDFRYVPNLHFPTPEDPNGEHIDTILDGELVFDKYPNGTRTLKYLVFDCLVIDGISLLHRTLDKRLGYFKEKLLRPYRHFYESHPQQASMRSFVVEDKSTQFSYGMEFMFREIIPKVKKIHGNDGLIFTCRSTPYQFGTDQHILKWKPPQENTIDFRMRLEFPTVNSMDTQRNEDGSNSQQQQAHDNESYTDYDAIPSAFLFIFTGNQGPGNQPTYQYFSPLYISPSDWEHMKSLNAPLDDSVIEAYLDEDKRWRFMRLRDDKDECNHISTVESVIESIEDRVDEDDLIKASAGIKIAWKKRAAEEEEERRRGRGVVGMKRKLDE